MTKQIVEIIKIEYRGYSILVCVQDVQWTAEITAAGSDLPDLLPEKQIVRGWDRSGVVERAKLRVDEELNRGGVN